MKLLYLTQVFEVGNDPGSDRHFFFCKYAVRNGHQTTAITSNVDYKKAMVKIPGGRGTVVRQVNGVDIHYVYSYPNFRGSFFKRFIYFLTYVFSSVSEVFKIEKPDVVYAVSTPLTVGLLGYVISRIRGIPFVFEVTDVWPDAPVACGVIKNPMIIYLAKKLEMFCYAKAVHIVALTYGIRANIVEKGVPSDKVSVITNGVDFSLFPGSDEGQQSNDLRLRLGYDDKFVAMYLGAHGAYNALDTIIDAAVVLRDNPEFLFVFVGDGDVKKHLQDRVDKNALTNVKFIPPISRTEAPAYLKVADAFLLPNRKGEFFLGNLPNKLFDFLASGKPIVVAGAGETATVIEQAGCGKVVDAENGEAMAQALLELQKLPRDDRKRMGLAGREHVRLLYDREVLSNTFLAIIQKAAGI